MSEPLSDGWSADRPQLPAPRVIFYSHDGFGLGHLRRNLKLAGRLTRDLPDASALLIAGFPGVPGVDLPPGVDLVKLPSIRKVATDTWGSRSLRIELSRLRAARRALIDGAFSSFEPHLVVVDYMPIGVWGELLAPLTRLRRQRPKAAIVLGLRDVLDSPLITRRTWRVQRHDEALVELFDAILVYGDRHLYDTSLVYGLEELAPERIFFTGYVCDDPPQGNVDSVRRKLAPAPDQELIVVTAGGGADAFPMMRLSVLACRLLADHGRPVRALVVTGPLMDSTQVAELERLSEGSPILVRRSDDKLERTLAAADVVVTMAAYNTLTEAVRIGRPLISIPRSGPSAEQVTRARLFADRDLIRTLPQRTTPERLAEKIGEALSEPLAAPRPPAMAGLEVATARLRDLLEGATAADPERIFGAGRLA
jgi:predicted glycosyltransferase